jgi:hypothetical protein
MLSITFNTEHEPNKDLVYITAIPNVFLIFNTLMILFKLLCFLKHHSLIHKTRTTNPSQFPSWHYNEDQVKKWKV